MAVCPCVRVNLFFLFLLVKMSVSLVSAHLADVSAAQWPKKGAETRFIESYVSTKGIKSCSFLKF